MAYKPEDFEGVGINPRLLDIIKENLVGKQDPYGAAAVGRDLGSFYPNKDLLKDFQAGGQDTFDPLSGIKTGSGAKNTTSVQENPNASDGVSAAMPHADGQMAMAQPSLMDIIQGLGALFGQGRGPTQVPGAAAFNRG